MNEVDVLAFGAIDYCVFAGMMIFSSLIGLYSSYIGNKSPEEYLMGNRSLNPISAALSLLTSYVTGVELLGFSGEAYAHGTQLSTIVLGVILSIIFSMYLTLPVLYPLKLTSINEYIQLRFKSKGLRLMISFISVVKFIFVNGVCLYAPTIAFAHVSKLDSTTSIITLGIVCTAYSSLGGIRAVVWTDIFQVIVVLSGLISVIGIGCATNGGFLKTLHISQEGGRLEFFNMNPSPLERYTFVNTVTYGFFIYLHLYSSNQNIIQRMCSVTTFKHARRVLTYNLYGMFILFSLMFIGGLVAYASYAGCDPMALGLINKKEQIVPYFILDKLSFVPGLAGLFYATLTACSLSTISSAINSSAALMWRDVCLSISYFKTASERSATLINKILSVAIGISIIGTALLASRTRGLVEITMTIIGTFQGPVLGVFMIGYFLPKCNMKGVWAGFILSSILTLWIGIGSLSHKKGPSFLPFSVDDCVHLNLTTKNTTDLLVLGENLANLTFNMGSESSFVEKLYQISKTLYGAFSTTLCIILALIVSFLTGNQNVQETSPKYISPYFRKFYWSEEEREVMLKNEIEVKSHNTEHDEIELKRFEESHVNH